MTANEILNASIALVGIVIGYSTKYIGNLLNKKKDETIQGFKLELLEKRVNALEKARETDALKLDKIAVIEERIKHLE